MSNRRKSFLLVDGYNIIHSWDILADALEMSLETARNKLIDILCDYKGTIRTEIIVVFDAHMVKGGVGSYVKHNNIFVVYTKEAETADHYIEKTTKSISKNYNVTVATNDYLEQSMILAEGASRITARELLLQITQAKERTRKEFIEKTHVKENSLFDSVSDDVYSFLEKLRFK